MNFQVTRINNETVGEVPLIKAKDTRPVKGAALFPELCANVFLCARKKSGKSSCIFKILKRCTGPNTKIMVFCSTIHKDATWESIRVWATGKGLPFVGNTSIEDDDGTNLLRDLIKGLQNEEADEKAEKSMLDSDSEEEEKPKKAKYQYPEWIFVFDDLSDELKKPIIATFLKKNRHFRAKIIISSQYMNDLLPAARKQLDYLCLFGGHQQKKIDEICKDVDIRIPKEQFYEIYKFATEEKYAFLYVDVRGGSFRRNFNEEIEVD